MNRRRGSLFATLLFFSFTAPFGIAAHLIAELAGLGWHDDADVVLSARHGYLALVAFAAVTVFSVVLSATPADGRRRGIEEIIAALPFRGHGVRFAILSFVLQFSFFGLTQIGEGCPLCGGDILTGLVAAAIAALLGALIVTFGKRRILEFASAYMSYERRWSCSDCAVAHCPGTYVAPRRDSRRTPFSFRYRPPPQAA